MAEFPERLCPHLHIPLQSGSNAVLQRMRRRSTAEEFLAQCDRIRCMLGEPALTTDVIVGFPGETEADFEATCRVVKEARFAKVHVFRFSAREGTPAATMPDQMSPPVKQHRAEVLSEIGRELRQAFCAGLIGQDLQVVAETLIDGRPGLLSGTADRYVTVQFPGGHELMDQIVRVTAVSVADDRIRAANVRG
jgi:threonylcarbamoyladenosine tRNA methylthiotransferase MtaB